MVIQDFWQGSVCFRGFRGEASSTFPDFGQVLLDLVLGIVWLNTKDVLIVTQSCTRILSHERHGHIGKLDTVPYHVGSLNCKS